jgi:hypothetical protein
MNEALRALIESGAVMLEDLVEAINGHEGRATAARDVIVAARCGLCGRGFPQQRKRSGLPGVPRSGRLQPGLRRES